MIRWGTIGLVLLGTLGAGTFGYSLLQQTNIQGNINKAMEVINKSIVSTGGLVQQTSQALEPLYDTTKGLAGIQQREEQVVQHLTGMNKSLEVIGQSESGIVAGLDSLNQVTAATSGALTKMGQANASIYAASSTSSQQSGREAAIVAELNNLTRISIAQLREMNEKLSLLRKLP